MRKINLMFIDYDEAYLASLNDFISKMYKGKFEVSCFSSVEIFIDKVKNINNKDVLIVNREMYDNSLENLGIKAILKLIEDNAEYEEKNIVHKFKDINNIGEIVTTAFVESNPSQVAKINSNNADTSIISVFSPVGGSGKSIIAAGLSKELAESGYEVFYLSLEDIQGTNVYFECENSTSLSDVIFEIKDRSEDYIQKLVASISIDKDTNVSFLNPTENILDIEDMDKEDIKWLLEGIIDTKKYHYVVIDMGSKYNSTYSIVLNSSDLVITPILDDITSRNKLERFIADIHYNLSKYYFVYNYCDNSPMYESPSCLTRIDREIDLMIKEEKQIRRSIGKNAINAPRFKNSINEMINKLGLIGR